MTIKILSNAGYPNKFINNFRFNNLRGTQKQKLKKNGKEGQKYSKIFKEKLINENQTPGKCLKRPKTIVQDL
jgi:hypothetical protein